MKRATRVLSVLFAAALVLPLLTAAPAAALPVAPTLISPTFDEATLNPIFHWGLVTGATMYHLEVSVDPAFPGANLRINENTPSSYFTYTDQLPSGIWYWRVRAIDPTGTGTYAVSQFVKLDPSAPIPLTPINGSTVNWPTPVVFSWQPMTSVQSYQIEISTNATFTPPLYNSTIDIRTTFYTFPQPTAIGTTYWWRVKGLLPGNVLTPTQNPSWSFTTTWTEVPTLTYPPDTTNPSIEEVVLKWNAMPGAAQYELQISPNSDFTNNTVSTTVKGTTYSPPLTLDNSAYYWRVRAINAVNGVGAWATNSPNPLPRQFKKEWPAPDAPPNHRVTLLTPSNSVVVPVQEPVFTWTPVRLASSYELQLSTDVNFSTFNTVTTNHTSYIPKIGDAVNPAPGVVYHWRVRPLDNPKTVNGLFSSVFDFVYYPFLPTQSAPADNATVELPILRWTANDPLIGRYRVTVVNDVTSATVFTKDTYQTMLVPQQLALGTYRWHVETLDQYGRQGPISGGAWRRFTLIAPAVTGPSPLPATPSGSSAANVPLLTWTPVTGATKYRIWFAVQGAPIFTRLPDSGTELFLAGYTHWQVPLSPGNYDWFVEAFDGASALLATGPLGGFTLTGLTNTVLTSPAHCADISVCPQEYDTPMMTWDPVPGAVEYRVYRATDANFTNIDAEYSTQFTKLTPSESLLDSQAGQGATFWYARPCYDFNPRCGPGPEQFLAAQPPIRAFRKQSLGVQLISPANLSADADEITFSWTDFLVSNLAQWPAGSPAAPPAVGPSPPHPTGSPWFPQQGPTQEAKGYYLQMSTANDFSAGPGVFNYTSPQLDQTTFTPFATTLPEGDIYWRVQAVDNSNNLLTWSPVRKVTRASPSPVQLTPADGSTVQGTPNFTWDPASPGAAGAYSYEIEVYKYPETPINVANKVWSQIIRTAAASPTNPFPVFNPDPIDFGYGWRVRRLDVDLRSGPWSAEFNTGLWRFDVTGAAPVLTAPADGVAVSGSNNLLLQWLPVINAVRYRVEVADNPAFVDPVKIETITTSATSWAPRVKYGVGIWYWRVTSLDTGSPSQIMGVSATRTLFIGKGGAFHPVTPFRALDSRNAATPGWPATPLGPGAVNARNLTVAPLGTVPSNATAVVMNVSVTGGTAASYLTAYPAGATPPTAANLLFAPNQTVPNLVTVKIGTSGAVAFFNQLGTVHVIADIVGWYDDGSDNAAARFNAIAPLRLLDSRTPVGAWGGPLGGPSTKDLTVAGNLPIPTTATAVVMNVTATGPTQASYISVYPKGAAPPVSTNLLFAPGQTVPNLVVVGLGSGGIDAGKVTFFNQLGNVHVIADVVGFFDPGVGSWFHPVTPVRFLDSRSGIGLGGQWTAGQTRTAPVANTVGLPSYAVGIVANMTAASGTAASYLSLSPTRGAPSPGTASLLFAPGQTIPNATYIGLGGPAPGKLDIYNQLGSVHVIGDVAGYFGATF